MKVTARFIFLFLIIAAAGVFAPRIFAQDFGLILNQSLTLADSDYVNYTAVAVPWFAAPLGEQADVYLSGGAGVEYEDEKWNPLYEIYRFELTWNYSPSLSFGFGRQYFQDSLGLILTGLFDGVSLNWNVGGGRFYTGLFYTGLLYKKSASITMNASDSFIYSDPDKYFASSRLAGGIIWEKTSIFDTQGSIWLDGIFQIDLNDADSKIHSQYVAAKYSTPLAPAFSLECGAAAEILEVSDLEPQVAFAASADLMWLYYGGIPGMLSLGGRFSTGVLKDTFAAFTPLTGGAQGKVLRPNLSGAALLQADYTFRPAPGLFAELFAAYLFRTDKTSFSDAGIDQKSDSPMLGAEIYLGVSWAPVSDFVLSAGGGIFVPQTGMAFTDNADIKYRLELTAGISL